MTSAGAFARHAGQRRYDFSIAWNRFTGRLDVGGTRMDLTEDLAQIAFGWSISPKTSLRVAAGGILSGTLMGVGPSVPRGTHTVGPGWVGSVQVDRVLLTTEGWRPFIRTQGTIGVSSTGTTDKATDISSTFVATDLRVGLTVGWMLGDRVVGYGATRLFAAPFYWFVAGEPESLSGQDINHYQVAIGGSVRVGDRWNLFADWSFFGERSLVVGLAMAWWG